MAKNVTKTERLLTEMQRRGGMTRKEMVIYLLSLTYGRKQAQHMYDPQKHGDYWNAQFYGTEEKYGLFERYCRQTTDGRWKVRTKNFEGPFYISRTSIETRATRRGSR